MKMTCAEAVFRTMVDLEYEKFFNIPGRGVYPLLEQFPKFPTLEYVTCLHEFPLAAIADGYVRASGKPAFVNLYMSTGVLNAASSIFLSQRDRLPMVITATQAESWAVGANHRAEIDDIVESMRPIVKWSWMPPSPDRVVEALVRAHTIATTAPEGPTFVAIPVDFWTAEVEYPLVRPTHNVSLPVEPRSEEMRSLADLIATADSPVLVVGAEAVAAGASSAVERISHRLGSAVVAEPEPARLPIASDSPLFGGSVAEAVDVIDASDLVVHIGVSTYEAFHRAIFTHQRHVWIGSDPAELNKVVPVSDSYIGPILAAVTALAEAIESMGLPSSADAAARRSSVEATIAAEKTKVREDRDAAWDESPLAVARVVSEIRRAMPADTRVLDHSTTAVRLVREFFPVPDGRQYISASGSCQGWGIGAAVGVQLADPDTPTVAFVGDGGFMFGLQAWWTAATERLPLLAVVLNNSGWGSMRASLSRNSPSVGAAGLDLHFGWDIDLAGVARGMGGTALDISSIDELTDALRTHLPLTEPLLLNVHVRHEKKTSASPFVGY